MEHYDVIIIGTGAGGGTLAHKLAPSGKKVLLLERGGYLPREPENWDSREVFRKERYLDQELWLDKDGAPYKPHQQYFVGGNTKFYGAILFRLRERDFHEVRHYGGTSPAWPLSYQDLEPYYAEAERLYLVHGQAGEDPTEPPRSGPFPYPAVSHEPRIQKLHDDFERTGHHPFHLPVGVDLDEADPEAGRCVRSDQVGRNYMAHINSGVIAISQTPNTTKFQKTLGVNDYYWGAPDSELPLGHIQMLGKSDRNILRAGAPWFAPNLVLDYMAKHAIDFWLTSEDLPHPANRVTVDRSGQIKVSKTYHNLEAHERLLAKLKALLGPLGCHES